MFRESIRQLVNSVDHFLRQDFSYTETLNCTEDEAISLIAPEWAKVELAAGGALGDAVDPAERTSIARIQTTVTNASDADQLVQAQATLQAMWPGAKAAFLASVVPSQPAASVPAAAARTNSSTKGKHVNEQMLKIIVEKPDCQTWSTKDWADRLDCSKSTVHGTTAWKRLNEVRAMAQVLAASKHKGDLDDEDEFGTGAGGGQRVTRKTRSSDDEGDD